MELISSHSCWGGTQFFYRHDSIEIGLPMRFSVFLPPQAAHGPVPVLFYLAGLTCNEETFPTKAGAQRYAAQHGIMLVAPDTSPRGAGIEGESDSWDFGVGAGFYLDATTTPWSQHYRMYSYVSQELRNLIMEQFPAAPGRIGIFGHSMGGHGALVLALRQPEVYRSVSAFAPVAAPSLSPWGEKAFTNYLGEDRKSWAAYDASALMSQASRPFPHGILIDQGLGDKFLEAQLFPQHFEEACQRAQQALDLRLHARYDHGYYFIQSFMEDHLAFHARILHG
ncbi:S-formylglutathione hydrolase [Herbaspirillum sp. RTI4]|uniref:S-formylglutathione hydrolase n=1 Tax=Herbaspirillum sp. RTI4 TaxID=3048640 RepID=UPI002AB576B1|nr:S-formylglutathione hydrolase [Herbaspirillum sp. RTI4]MDY7578879.1 S-formylglutathione hydrolase [Herbaspirillum sp. RTI4]MEA9981968.1 S-formylglutathione hydrolase [Herbaspirillum sp. RTI4]